MSAIAETSGDPPTKEKPIVDREPKYLLSVMAGIVREEEPLDLAHVVTWVGDSYWSGGNFTCNVCSQRSCDSYEVHLQWGDTNRYIYLSEVCPACMDKICRFTRNAKNHPKYVFSNDNNEQSLPSIGSLRDSSSTP